MKVLKGLGFFLLALLVFCAFITPVSIVPKSFEERARELTLERLEKTGSVVDESYIQATVSEAVHSNLHSIYRTAVILSLAAAMIVCVLSIRPPHDRTGVNLFNPLALPIIAVITVCMALGIFIVLNKIQGKGVSEFKQLWAQIDAACVTRGDRLLITLIIPVMLEVIFRGYILSFLEKLHFSVGIVLSSVMYGLVAYYCFYSFGMRSIGSSAAAEPALFIALFVGLVFSVIDCRLGSGIPSALAHVLLANSAGLVARLGETKLASLPIVLVVMAVLLAVLVFFPVLFFKKIPLFAYDFPFTRHHKRMNKWFRSARNERSEKASRRKTVSKSEGEEASEERELKLTEGVRGADAAAKKSARAKGKGRGGKSAASEG